jgi:hypothetical protein
VGAPHAGGRFATKALLALSNFEESLVLEFAQKTAPLSVRKAKAEVVIANSSSPPTPT